MRNPSNLGGAKQLPPSSSSLPDIPSTNAIRSLPRIPKYNKTSSRDDRDERDPRKRREKDEKSKSQDFSRKRDDDKRSSKNSSNKSSSRSHHSSHSKSPSKNGGTSNEPLKDVDLRGNLENIDETATPMDVDMRPDSTTTPAINSMNFNKNKLLSDLLQDEDMRSSQDSLISTSIDNGKEQIINKFNDDDDKNVDNFCIIINEHRFFFQHFKSFIMII